MVDKTVYLTQAEGLMKKTLEKYKQMLVAIRAGRASAAMLDGIKVEAYNSEMALNQVAGVSIPDAKTIEIRPWDASVIPTIEKAIFKSSLGLTPVNDGKVVRLSIPPLTQERRDELIKHVKKTAEEFKVSMRNDRRIAVEDVKKAQKDKKVTEDDRFKIEDQLQKILDAYVKKIDEASAAKEKEIML
jgi:ribosome recycling factor